MYTDVEQHIREELIVTPEDWEKKLGVYQGATFNMGHNWGQMLFLRPHNQFEEFEHCYLVGGGTHPGSGLPTIFRVRTHLVESHLLSISHSLQPAKAIRRIEPGTGMNPASAMQLVDRARAAQAVWASSKFGDRVSALARLRRQIAVDRESLVDAIVSDTGKPALDALSGDVLVTLEQMRFYERRAATLLAPRRVGRSLLFYPHSRFREHLEPYGIVLVFGPANYPLQLSLVPAITALYAGNAVLLKVSERTASVANAIEQVVQRAVLPAGLLQVVCATPEESAALIEAEPDFVFFTGSSEHGKTVAAAAAARGIPSLLELGGSDAALVFADCNFARTVEGVVYGAFCNAGQVCVGIKRLVVQREIYDSLVGALVRRTEMLRVGAGHNGDLGRLPSEAARNWFDGQVRDALDRGAKLETSATAPEGTPVILSNVSPHARLLREESFGPVLCVQPFATEEEAVAMANASEFALGASVWTRNFERGRRVAHALNAGNCSINDVICNVANPHAAFGGNAASGYGRYHGEHGLRAFSRIKTIMENHSPQAARSQLVSAYSQKLRWTQHPD